MTRVRSLLPASDSRLDVDRLRVDLSLDAGVKYETFQGIGPNPQTEGWERVAEIDYLLWCALTELDTAGEIRSIADGGELPIAVPFWRLMGWTS